MRKMISELNFIIILSWWALSLETGANGGYACGLFLKYLSD